MLNNYYIEISFEGHASFFFFSLTIKTTTNGHRSNAIFMTDRFDWFLYSRHFFFFFSFSQSNFLSIIMSINHTFEWEHRLQQLVVSILPWLQTYASATLLQGQYDQRCCSLNTTQLINWIGKIKDDALSYPTILTFHP
jgi:hypothetical protein